MKVFATCMQCQIDLGHPSFEPFEADYFDNGIADIECSAGHKTVLVMQSQKFEMLLDSGATALLQGFTLEACASFAAALERLYEFGIHIAFVGRNMPEDLFDGMFSQMSQQSERQLGAFMILHALEFGCAYKPNKKTAKFRNRVIHKGKIPTVEEARGFCSDVYDVIYKLVVMIRTKYGDGIQSVVMKELVKRQAKLPRDMRVSTIAGLNFFSIVREANALSFSDALDSFKEGRAMLSAAAPAMMALHKALQKPQA